MGPLLLYPASPSEPIARAFESRGWAWKGIGHSGEVANLLAAEEWAAAVVSTEPDAEEAFSVLRALRGSDSALRPLLVVCGAFQLADLETKEDLFEDFCLSDARTEEIATRLGRLLWRSGHGDRPELIEYGPLSLNLETYQASVSGKPLDLTYMEYELLRFLAARPGKVFTRETLLSRVWGYEYYGGARTVDVHVRRLRAKLGEQHANLIQTVRSVGYRFGQAKRWPS